MLRSLRSPRSASRGTIASLSPLVLLVACSYVWFSYTLMKEGGCVGISAGTRYELLTPQVACMLARVSVHACEQMWRASLSLRASGGQQRRRSGTTDGNAPFAVWGSDPPPLTRTLEVASSPGNPFHWEPRLPCYLPRASLSSCLLTRAQSPGLVLSLCVAIRAWRRVHACVASSGTAIATGSAVPWFLCSRRAAR